MHFNFSFYPGTPSCHNLKNYVILINMKKPILLVNPWIYDFSAYDLWLAPLGLLSLGGLLRKNGYHTTMIDCLKPSIQSHVPGNFEKLPKRFESGHGHFRKENLPKPASLLTVNRQYSRYGMTVPELHSRLRVIRPPELILVTSMMTYWYPAVFDIIRILKGTFPDVPLILGGNYVTLCPEHACLAGADQLVAGEGEPQIPDILKKYLGNDPHYRVDPANLDTYPWPAYDLYERIDQVSIMTSRGCPFRCSYCASQRITPGYRRRNPVRVADEITAWHEGYGVSHFSFYDDALLMDPEEMAIPLLKQIIRRTPSCQFHCPNGLHLRAVSAELADLMFRAGFRTIRFGFETADPERQADTGGKATNEDLERAVRYLREAGYDSRDIGVYLLCGLPGQRSADVQDAIRFVKHCGARPIIAEYSPIPGTALWDAAVRASVHPIAEEPLFQNNSLLSCRSDRLSYEMYQELKRLSRMS